MANDPQESAIVLPPDSTGKALRTTSLTVREQLVQMESQIQRDETGQEVSRTTNDLLLLIAKQLYLLRRDVQMLKQPTSDLEEFRDPDFPDDEG